MGEQAFEAAAIEQVWDYALDLKNFHEASHFLPIVPILIATEADAGLPAALRVDSDGVYRPVVIGRAHLRSAIDLAIRSIHGSAIQPVEWARAQYRPTPTIIEAARALYAHHSVEAIARFDAGAENLRVTSSRIDELVDEAMAERRKLICSMISAANAGATSPMPRTKTTSATLIASSSPGRGKAWS